MAEIEQVEFAYIFPPDVQGQFHITDAAGTPVRSAATSVRHRLILPHYQPLARRGAATSNSGRYLYCGMGFGHFGHFVLETLSRLWAYDHVKHDIDGLIFFIKNRNPPNLKPYQSYFEAAGITHPFLFVTEPVQVDRLYVPQQGMGMGPFSTGLPQQRAWLDRTFRALATPVEPAEKVYISRSGYKLRRGGFLAEAAFERTLADVGYKIFHPQKAPMGEQIGTYLAAKQIVSADSSALHVVGFVAQPEQDLAIILRRAFGTVDLTPQLSAKMRKEPLVIDAIKQMHAPRVPQRGRWGSYAELDFAQVYATLIQHGFLPEDVRIPRRMRRFATNELQQVAADVGPLIATDPLAEPPSLDAVYFPAAPTSHRARPADLGADPVVTVKPPNAVAQKP